MEGRKKSSIWGIMLIIIGIGLLGNNLGWFYFDWENAWPWILILGGVLFWIQWSKNRTNYGVLMPGTIMLTYGFLFLYESYHGWNNMDNLWAVFILGPGLGLFAMYIAGRRERGLLVSGGILTVLSAIYLLDLDRWDMLVPLILIAIGASMIFKGRKHFSDVPPSSESTSS